MSVASCLLYKVLGPDHSKNEFSIYSPSGKPMEFHYGGKRFEAQGPMQFTADLLMVHGTANAEDIEYVTKFEDSDLKPILLDDGRALMTVWFSKYNANGTTLGHYHEAVFIYWVTKDVEPLVLSEDNVARYLRNISLGESEHHGIFRFVDKLYLDQDLPIAVGREWGYDKVW